MTDIFIVGISVYQSVVKNIASYATNSLYLPF